MSNTRKFNKRVQALRAKNARISLPQTRRIRAPAHGLLGDSHSQRLASRASRKVTLSLPPAQQEAIRRKGQAAAQFIRSTTSDRANARTPSPSPPPLNADAFLNNSFGMDGMGNDSDSDEEEPNREQKIVEEEISRVEYRDFRSRRDRTDTATRYWEEQMEDLVDAYMDWVLREKEGTGQAASENAAGAENAPLLWLDVVDIFGNCSYCSATFVLTSTVLRL